MYIRILLFLLLGTIPFICHATPHNIATKGRITVSSTLDNANPARCVTDGIMRIDGLGEWLSGSEVTFWGEIDFPWIELRWESAVTINRVVIYDRPSLDSHAAGGTLHFSDGTSVGVYGIPNNGAPRVVNFAPKTTEYIRFEITDGTGTHIGLSEIEVYPAPTDYNEYIEYVDPYIETTRGRYFFFVTGSQPYGMISAAPLTRNKNQGGGGYNYNDSEILGFPQIHGWMLSGLSIMPATVQTDPTLGEQGWKSEFSHDGEVVQPGYHRLYLDRYNAQVEQTATDRASLYRIIYSDDTDARILFNLGGYIGTTTMVNARAHKVNDRKIVGSFSTTGRLWGGPDNVKIFFTAEFDRAFTSLDSWVGDTLHTNISGMQSNEKAVPRNEGMSYSDAPSAGIAANFALKKGEPLLLKIAISYTSIENAERNMASSGIVWDFDTVLQASRQEWNDYLGRIAVKGGRDDQRVKFYTDLWHVLLGRHKIDDCNGAYPDYTTGGTRQGKYTYDVPLKIRQLPCDKQDNPRHHMYNSDAVWLTQWNLNSLWGIAYPSILDDFAASFLQYSLNGGLLPRGPNAGGYSFIMSGCPATSLITSAYQRGISHKWSVTTAYKAMKRNHERGGMLAIDQDDDLAFYIANGYCPDRAGLTIQWAFEDWALGNMARKLGKRKEAAYYHRRADGWKQSFNPELKLILPRRGDSSWLHTNPLDGWGYEEANAWQATFGVSHDIPGLALLMGGNDTLCAMLQHAFMQSVTTDFVTGYGRGYVSYANQPGLSNAHVFAHAGKPWLSQYWVRRVKEQAYGAITPDKGYGGHDEDQGQMGALSALMAIGLFSLDGGASITPTYDITSPIFDEICITLDADYCSGKEFRIKVHNNSDENCYIQRARLNGEEHTHYQITHEALARGGVLELFMGPTPNPTWGVE
ncbi:MAG: GH92 family glycosyl hydrolase [Coprobacter sp.]|nr:GH92 family glycosyl hydrolase [Coprobacter sp.]